ncbi:MAG: glycosyltransferase family 2 protein [Bacteroidales bacterium]|nr:glycosyltransferase family 2 protein [Bacteroidales bacterium]
MTTTVFTPTFNRAYTLNQLYKSLIEQSDKNFEWLIVDDGSTDDTELLVEQFLSERQLSIRYLKQKNGGKQRAINRGVLEAKGELFFNVDSDDFLTFDAIEKIHSIWKNFADDPNLGGLCFRKKSHRTGEIIGPKFPYQSFVASSLDVAFKYGVGGDKAEIFVTKKLKEYPFPVPKNEKFVPEGYIWNKLSRKYPLLFVDDPVYMCDYLGDGYTSNIKGVFRRNPKGVAMYYKDILKYKEVPLKEKLKALIRYMQMKYYILCKNKN